MEIRKNRQKYQFGYLEKGALELCRAAKTKPRLIERFRFFSAEPQRTNSTDWSRDQQMFHCGEKVIPLYLLINTYKKWNWK